MQVKITVGERNIFNGFINIELLSPLSHGENDLSCKFQKLPKASIGGMWLGFPELGDLWVIKPGDKVTIEFKEGA